MRFASTQVTLAPSWGNYQALPVALVENINVRYKYTPTGEPDLDDARTQYRLAYEAYKAAGADVGFYIGADLLEGDQPYYPNAAMTPDPNWKWGSIRYARKNGLPMVAKYEGGGLRWTPDRDHSPTLSRTMRRVEVLLKQRTEAAGVRPDFLFLDNCGLRVNGGSDDLTVFTPYAETLADKLRCSVMVNCSATPTDWRIDEWDAVAFSSQCLRDTGRWLGFAFETAMRSVMLGGEVDALELAAFESLINMGCRVVWDVGLPVPDGSQAAQARLADAARRIFSDGLGPYVGCDFFRPMPTWGVDLNTPTTQPPPASHSPPT